MQRRSYRGASDVERLQAFTAAAFAETDGCGFLHPGDLPHRLFSGNKLFEPAEVLTIWERGGEVAAWVLASPRHRGYDAQVRPDLRSPSFEREILEYAEAETLRLMAHHGYEGDLAGWVYRGDTVREEVLSELGWAVSGDPPEVLNRRTLEGVEEAVVPDGYLIRAVQGLEDAGALAEVHAAAFGSTWTPESYGELMQTPGYAAEREVVVESPGGGLAAFTVTWHDHVNGTGYFEPVGTHPDHQRMGLGTALLRFGMRAMADAGLRFALVANAGTNEASCALYRSVGFRSWHLIDGYTKAVTP
jgi:ribosomal protein S18 acetylase RimI-like enzyme